MKKSVLLLGLLVLAGCAGGGGASRDTPPPPVPVDPEMLLFVPDPNTIRGTWVGSYICSQGRTALQLELQGNIDGSVEGIFRFRAHPSNPEVPSGSYRVTGRLSPWGILVLQGGEWIERPEPYITVGLVGRVEGSPDRFHGFVDGPDCTTFSLRRSVSPVTPSARSSGGASTTGGR